MMLPGRTAGAGPGVLALPRRATLLAAYTAAVIVAAAVALGAGTLALVQPGGAALRAEISIGAVPAPWSGLAGLVAWTAFACFGGMRVLRDPGGHASLTLHLPFIAAAMILGGPMAGAWVAALGTFDRRELREAPWYGVLFNHGGLVLAALAGGLVLEGGLALAGALGLGDGSVVLLAAGLAGTAVVAVVSALLSALTVVLRDGLAASDTLALMDAAFRRTAVAESLLGWLLVVVWMAVGWWAPVLCTALVLTLWQAAADADRLDHDELTGVLTRGAFAVRVAEAADRARRGVDGAAYLFLDLDDFKSLNDGPRSHEVGDQVLAALGARLRACARVTDAVGRRGGDEFLVLFNGVRDEATALRLAERVMAAVHEPFGTDDGPKRIGASIGVALALPGPRDFEPDLRAHADAAMYEAKAAGGGVRLWRRPESTAD